MCLSTNYQNNLINKIKDKFTNKEQQLFAGSFYCYLNHNSKKDFVVDLDDIWKWIGFSRKDHAKRLLEKFFVENIDYKKALPFLGERFANDKKDKKNDSQKIIETINGGQNKEQILMTINTFKKFCLKAGTDKADEIHDYYIKLEELLHETINEETAELRNQLSLKDAQLEKKDKQHIMDLKLKKHDTLVELLKTKRCVYLGEIEENLFEEGDYVKVGSSEEVDFRAKKLDKAYGGLTFLEIFECQNFREIEYNILHDPAILKHLYREPIKTDGSVSFEVVRISNDFTYDNLLSIVKKHVATDNTIFMTPENLLEKQRLDIRQQELNIEEKKLNGDLLLAIMNSNKFNDEIQKTMKDTLLDVLKNVFANNKFLTEEPKKEQLIEKKINNPNNEIISDINRNAKKPQGRKIRKIDPNDITKVITVYDSMMYLLRLPEHKEFKRVNLLSAIAKNSIFQGFRWNFVEDGQDPNASNAEPTDKSIIEYKAEVILQLDETKTKILNSFSTKIGLATELGITKKKLSNIIGNNVKFNGCYYIPHSKCPETILKEYKGSTKRSTKKILNCIKQINPITKEELIFNTFDEISVKLGIKARTIKNAIEKKIICNGSIWEFCKDHV